MPDTSSPRPSALHLISAPCGLGLRPLRPGHVPGTWRAPAALLDAGLPDRLDRPPRTELEAPAYSPDPQPGTRLYNGPALRAFNLRLAAAVEAVLDGGRFPLVVGGDCSILLGCLAGARRRGPVSLLHIDGHSDFRHPGNYDPSAVLGAVAGMDLALATGRGEALLTDWPSVSSPLVPDRQVVQLGERENRDADFAWPDVNATGITRIDAFAAQGLDAGRLAGRIRATLDREPDWPVWIHLDVDVLDQAIMPAVDSPGSPGVDPDKIVEVCRGLVQARRCRGMTVTVFDPDLDPEGVYARRIVDLVAGVFTEAAA